jgi:flagellar biosynthesis chaperone FliJ
MARFTYRLQQLLDVKLERKEELQQELGRRLQDLAAEQQAGEELRRERILVEERVTAARTAMLSGTEGVSGRTIRQHADYVRGVSSDLAAAKDAEFAQELRIREFEERAAAARRLLADCAREVEVLDKHRDRLERRFLKELEKQEAIQQDDITNSKFHPERRAHESFT